MADQVAFVRPLQAQYGDPDGLESMDDAWAALAEHARGAGGDPNVIINAIGLAFGQWLVDHAGMTWSTYTDATGTEIVVRGPNEATVFPTNLVAKRFESGEVGFLKPIGDGIVGQLERLQAPD